MTSPIDTESGHTLYGYPNSHVTAACRIANNAGQGRVRSTNSPWTIATCGSPNDPGFLGPYYATTDENDWNDAMRGLPPRNASSALYAVVLSGTDDNTLLAAMNMLQGSAWYLGLGLKQIGMAPNGNPVTARIMPPPYQVSVAGAECNDV